MKAKQLSIFFVGAVMLFTSIFVVPVFADYDKEIVQTVQQALNDAGFDCGTPDGVAGNKTAAAITEYQKANGLPEDGVISEELLASLGIGSASATTKNEIAEENMNDAADEDNLPTASDMEELWIDTYGMETYDDTSFPRLEEFFKITLTEKEVTKDENGTHYVYDYAEKPSIDDICQSIQNIMGNPMVALTFSDLQTMVCGPSGPAADGVVGILNSQDGAMKMEAVWYEDQVKVDISEAGGAIEEATDEVTEAADSEEVVASSEEVSEMSDQEKSYLDDYDGYICSPDDFMFFTYGDGYTYRCHLDGDDFIFERISDEGAVEEGYDFSINSNAPYINYVVDKYFYAAKANEEGLPHNTFEFDYYEWMYSELEAIADPEVLETMKQENAEADATRFFNWSPERELLFTFSDGTSYKMFCEEDVLKVGRIENGELKELLSFTEEDKEEAADFIERMLVSIRQFNDTEYSKYINQLWADSLEW